MEEQYSKDGAICPYCGHLHQPCDTDYSIYDENLCTFDCHDCGKKFNISLYVSYSWTTTQLIQNL